MSPTSPTDLCFLPATELAAHVRKHDLLASRGRRELSAPNRGTQSGGQCLHARARRSRRRKPRGPPRRPSWRDNLWGLSTACRSRSKTSTMSPACRHPWGRSRSKIASRKPARRPSKDCSMRAQSYSARRTVRNLVTRELRTTYALARQARRGRSGTILAARRVGARLPWLMAWPHLAGDRWRRLGADPSLFQRRRRIQTFLRPCAIGDPAMTPSCGAIRWCILDRSPERWPTLPL